MATTLALGAAAVGLLVFAIRSRKGSLWRVLAALGSLLLFVIAYGLAIEPRLVLAVQEERATIPALPEAWEGKRVAVLADLQVGMWWDSPHMARRAVARILEESPAVVLIAGDFVYGQDDTAANVEEAVAIVAPLAEAGIPTYAVLGNHDYESGAAAPLREALERRGIHVLENEVVAVPPSAGGAPLYVVGIAPKQGDRADPTEALADLDDGAPRIALMHDPDTFERLPRASAPLAVAGHTHGGQLRVPWAPQWSYLGWMEGHTIHADGWIEDFGAPGNRLYVNRGIGMSAIPMRINCSPAVTLFALEAG